MDIQIGSLAVNAAFLDEIKRDNIQLRSLLQETVAAMRGPPLRRHSFRAIYDLLASLQDQLATHFALEEYFGYFDDAVDVAPHLSARAIKLRDEHGTLFREMCEIVSDAEALLAGEVPRVTSRHRIARRFLSFYEQMERHESAERELIMQALCDDIGSGD